ncbi:MAG: addiction module protein [Rhodocyclaceae bacterium]|nr:addiction module protein [Rhodocyclaceae bacterium]
MKTSDLIDKAAEEAIEAAWQEVTQRRLAELRTGAVMAIEGEKIFMRIHDRYVFARKQS